MKKKSFFFAALLLTINAFSQDIEFDQILNWTGSGSNVAILVVDFNDGAEDCFAFGFRFEGAKTADDMLNDIALAISNFSVNTSGGFLQDLSFEMHNGTGGSPFYWMTFVHNGSQWEMNWDGIDEVLTDSMYFAASYTDVDSSFTPLNLPENPIPAPVDASVNEFSVPLVQVFPNPVTDELRFVSDDRILLIEISDISGKLILTESNDQSFICLNISILPAGLYMIRINCQSGVYATRFVKK
jgi:hypothetical protein